MVAVDSSTIIAYLQGGEGADVALFDAGLLAAQIALPPAVLTEILSEFTLPRGHAAMILAIPVLEITSGYWTRAAVTRGAILSRRLRARLPDALIAQSCIDHDVALITRDDDFRHFAEHCGLRLA